MKKIRSGRILILPCTISLAKSFILYGNDLKMASPVSIPERIPSDRMKGMLPLLIELLELGCEADWWICFIIDLENQQFIGELEVGVNLSNGGSVSFSLNFTDGQTEEEFAAEVIEGLLYYFEEMDSIQLIKTEIEEDRAGHKKILMNCGFKIERVEGPYCLLSKKLIE